MIGDSANIKYLSEEPQAAIRIQTLGKFQVWRGGKALVDKDWGRDATLQLIQFFVTARHRKGLHREQISDRLWPDADMKAGEQLFKVAMHGVNKVLEPERKSRQDPKYVTRQGITYQLNLSQIWIDVEQVDKYIAIGNQYLVDQPKLAMEALHKAVELYEGIYLPNRLYEDWSSEERERIQLLTLGALTDLSELHLDDNPSESVRLTQKAIQIDHTWEDAYRIQMEAFLKSGNRPMVMKTYKQCEKMLDEEFAISPLPMTSAVLRKADLEPLRR